jgi:hypothetical protein
MPTKSGKGDKKALTRQLLIAEAAWVNSSLFHL